MASPIAPRGFNRRRFLRLSAAAGAGLALAACRRSATTPLAPLPEAGNAGTPVNASRGGTLRWAEFYSTLTPEQEKTLGINAQANLQWMATVAGQFQQENRGWQVAREPVPLDEMDGRWVLDANANVTHDVVPCTSQLLPRHQQLGDLLDLTPYLQKMAQSDRDDLGWSAAWQAGAVGGQQVAVPIGLRAHGLVCGREAYKQAGLDDQRPPETLDELLAAAQKLTQPGQDLWGLGIYAGRGAEVVEQTYAPLVWHHGGDIFDQATGRATLTTNANTMAAQWLLDACHTQRVVRPSAFGKDAAVQAELVDAPVEGHVGQSFGFGSYWLPALQTPGLVSGCVPPDRTCKGDGAVIAPLPTTGKAGFLSGRCLSIHRLSPEPEVAFKLLEVILRPENLRTYPDQGLPARLSGWRAREYSSAIYQAWQVAAKAGRPMPPSPYYLELAAAISAALADILNQKAQIPAALSKAEDSWNDRFARA